MAHGDAREGKWRGNWRMDWVVSTLHTTSEHGVSSITTADVHTSAGSSRLNWRLSRFKWTRPFRQKTKSVFCACAITFQLAPTSHAVATETRLSPVAYQIGVTVGGITIFCLIVYCLLPTNETLDTVHPVSNLLIRQRVQCGVYLHSLGCYAVVMNGRMSQLSAPNTFAIELLCIHSFDGPATTHTNQPLTLTL